jgi:D-alanyl-D-alanine carboxypeptidase
MWLQSGAVLAVAAVVGLIATPAPAAAAGGMSGDSRLRAEIQQLVDVDGIPGVTALVSHNGVTERTAAGLADIPNDQPMRPADQFRVGSVTKSFVATVVLQLVAEHRLALDQPIDGLLPEPIPNAGHITVRELLDHTSGLFNYNETPGLNPGAEYTPAQLIALSVQHPPYFAPGTGFHYSNTDYIVLGEIVGQVTGGSIQDEVRTRLIDRLGLRGTTFPAQTTVAPRQARGYDFAAPLPPATGQAIDTTTLVSASAAGAAGSMVSDTDDLDRFLAALFGGRLLPRPLLDQMEQPTPGAEAFFAAGGIPNVSYGLGLMMGTTPCGTAYGHLGGIAGYTSLAMRLGDRQVVMLMNTDAMRLSLELQIISIAEQELCPR